MCCVPTFNPQGFATLQLKKLNLKRFPTLLRGHTPSPFYASWWTQCLSSTVACNTTTGPTLPEARVNPFNSIAGAHKVITKQRKVREGLQCSAPGRVKTLPRDGVRNEVPTTDKGMKMVRKGQQHVVGPFHPFGTPWPRNGFFLHLWSSNHGKYGLTWGKDLI